MADLPTTYTGDLAHPDVLRQLFLHERALSCDGSWAHGADGNALKLRILRGLRRYDEARRILDTLPEADDTIALRENRLIVMERLRKHDEFDRLSGDLNDVLSRGGGRGAYRIAVAIARHQAAIGTIRRAEAQLEDLLSGWRTESHDPPGAVAFGWRLQYLLRLGDLRRAREVANDLVLHPHWPVRATMAAFLSRLDQTDLALDILREITDSNPGYPTAWRRYISTLRILGQFDRAEKVALRASDQVIDVPPLADDPGQHPERLSLGDHPLILVERAQLELARYDGDDSERLRVARELADTAMTMAPHCSEAWWIKARALRFQPTAADLAELRALSKSEAAAGDETVVQIESAHALADATRWERAKEAYQDVLRAHRGNRDALFGLLAVVARRTPPVPEARALESIDATDLTVSLDAEGLRKVARMVLSTLSEDSVMLCLGGERLAQSGHYAMAHELFAAAADLCAPDPNGRPGNEMSAAGTIRAYGWARTFDKVGDEHQADPMLVRLAHGMILGDRGYLLRARNLFERLVQDYPAARRDNKGRDAAATAAVWYSNSLRSLFEHDRAQGVIESALATASRASGLGMRGADLYDELGCIWLDRNNYQDAKAAFTKALCLAPAHVGALRGMIQVHRALGQLDEASRWVKKAACLHPQDASIRMEEAWLFGESGRFGLAHEALDAVTARDIAQPAALEWRIVYLMRQGRREEARVAAELARRYRPESPSIAETASTVPLQAGDWVEAVQWVHESCRRFPGDHRFAIVAASICGLVTKSADNLPSQAAGASEVTSETEAFVRTGIAELLDSVARDERPEAITAWLRFVRRRRPLPTDPEPADQAPAGVVGAAMRRYRRVKDMIHHSTQPTEAPRTSVEHLIIRDLADPLLEFPPYRMELAELALLERRTEVALAELAALYKALPWWTRVVIQYAMTLAMAGYLNSARAVADESLRRARKNGDPCPVELLMLRGELSLRANYFADALDDARQAVQHGSRQYMTAQLFHINCYSALGQVDEAYAMATELNGERPISRKARVGLARTLDLVGHSFEAAALVQGTKPLFAHDRPSVVMTSWMMRNAGDTKAAEEYMTEARRLMPASTGVLGELGWTYLERGKEADARDAFAKLNAVNDAHTRALGMTGLLWCDMLFSAHSDIEKSDFRDQLEASAKRLAALAGTVSEAHFAASIAFRLLANGDEDAGQRRKHLIDALKEARQATNIDGIAVYHRLVGRILYDLGSVSSAKDHLERSIKLQPYRGDYAGLGLIHLSHGDHAKAIETIETGLQKLADSWSADSGFLPMGANQVDLYAALGATLLDIDLRSGTPADATKAALRFLRQAVEANPRHPFAVDNLATALTFTGSSREAVRILRSAITQIAGATAIAGSPTRRLELWFYKRDLTALRERLVEVLRTIAARDGMNPLRAREIRRLLTQIGEVAPERAEALESMPSQHLTDVARTRRHRRWAQLAVTGLTALATAGVVWFFDLADDWGITKVQLAGLTAVLLVVTLLLGFRVVTGIRLKITGVEVDLQLSASVEMLDLPTRISAHLGFGRFDAARTQWTTMWTSESRLPHLGPTVAPLINSYYSHRDQVLPWRRR
ncbi:MAG: tetratricopeptide repeat protein [Micromonosporaceae bacterium]